MSGIKIPEVPVFDIWDLNIKRLKNLLHDNWIRINSTIYANNIEIQQIHTTLLCAAVKRKDYKLVDFLITQNADIDLVTEGSTPLFAAIGCNDLKMVKKLHKLGADINLINSSITNSPLMKAVRERTFDIIKYLIEQGADVNAVDPTNKFRPLHYACVTSGDNIKIVELLLKSNADIDAKAIGNSTALKCATCEGKLELAKLLIARGADINYCIVSSWMFNEMIMFNAQRSSTRRRYQFIEYLLSIDEPMTDINVLNREKRNLLHWEMIGECKHDNLHSLLLNAGIDVNAEDYYGKLALNYNNDVCKQNLNFIKQHIVKLIAVGLPVCERNRQAVEENFDDFKNSCDQEVKTMKINKIGASNIFFFDIFFMSIHYLAVRLKFAGLNQVIDKKNLRIEYPEFGGMIYFKLLEVERRIEYLQVLENSVEETLHKWRIPYTFIRELWYYFSNIELKKFITDLEKNIDLVRCSKIIECITIE